MKLKNLLFGTMVALAFTACSSDNDPVIEPTPDPVEGNATLSVRLNPVTKATGTAFIDNIYVVVAKADGVIEAIEPGASTDSEVLDIELSEGIKQVLVVANFPIAKADYANLTDLVTAIDFATDKAKIENGTFTMNSKLYTGIRIYAEQEHFLGYVDNSQGNGIYYAANGTPAEPEFTPVKLYRNVAQVDLSKIAVGEITVIKEEKIDDVITKEEVKLTGAKFELDTIAIVQTPAKTNLVPAGYGEWATTFLGTDFLTGFDAAGFAGLKLGDKFKKVGAATEDAYYMDDMYTNDAPLSILQGNSINPELTYYVYENTNVTEGEDGQNLTLLTLKGTISGTLPDGKHYELPNRYYTAAIGVSGMPNGYVIGGDAAADYKRLATGRSTGEVDDKGNPLFKGVLRNVKYDVKLTLKGIGSISPYGGGDDEKGYLDVLVQVVSWGTVTQEIDVE